MVHENLDVNSDQVNNLAEPYQYAATDFHNLSGRIDEIWSRYKNAWGHDSIGAQVAPSFEQGFQYLQGSAKALHETLNYYSVGLSESGKVYGESEDNAAEGSQHLDSAFSQLETPAFRMPAETAPFKTARRMAVESEHLEPAEEDAPRLRMASRSVERGEPTQPGEPMQPLMRAERVEAPLLQPAEYTPAIPAMPAIPADAVVDPSIPPDAYGPWYRLPDGSIIAHPAESARIPVTPTDS